jgi:hypothetical protein
MAASIHCIMSAVRKKVNTFTNVLSTNDGILASKMTFGNIGKHVLYTSKTPQDMVLKNVVL